MKKAAPLSDGIDIVIKGAFNPMIFHPTWFARQELLSEGDAYIGEKPLKGDESEGSVVHPSVAEVRMNWLRIRVVHNEFIAISAFAYSERLRDLVVGTFRTLKHTPLYGFEIERDVHLRMAASEMARVLDLYAPKAAWSRILRDPTVTSVVCEESAVENPEYKVRVNIEKSHRYDDAIFIEVGHKLRIPSDSSGTVASDQIIKSIQSHWEDFVSHSTETIDRIVEPKV